MSCNLLQFDIQIQHIQFHRDHLYPQNSSVEAVYIWVDPYTDKIAIKLLIELYDPYILLYELHMRLCIKSFATSCSSLIDYNYICMFTVHHECINGILTLCVQVNYPYHILPSKSVVVGGFSEMEAILIISIGDKIIFKSSEYISDTGDFIL